MHFGMLTGTTVSHLSPGSSGSDTTMPQVLLDLIYTMSSPPTHTPSGI